MSLFPRGSCVPYSFNTLYFISYRAGPKSFTTKALLQATKQLQAAASKYSSTKFLFKSTVEIDVRKFSDPEGTLKIRTFDPKRIDKLSGESFDRTIMSAAKVLFLDTGKEGWRDIDTAAKLEVWLFGFDRDRIPCA